MTAPELPDLRTALYTTLRTGLIQDGQTKPLYRVYRVPSGLKELPGFVIGEITADFTWAMAKGMDVYHATLYACVSPGSDTAFDTLDAMVSGIGSASCRQIIFEHSDLGLPGYVSSAMLSWHNYGALLSFAGNQAVGAIADIIISAKATD